MNEQEKIFNDLLVFYGRITFLTIIIPILIGIWKFKTLNRPLRIFFYYLLLTLVLGLGEQIFLWVASNTTWVNWFLKKWNIGDTNFYQIVYYLKNFIFLSWFFSEISNNKPVNQKVKWVGGALFVAAIINYIFIEGYNVYGVFNPTADAVFCFVVPCIALWFIYHVLTKVPLIKNPFFWINLGLVIQNLIALILFFIGKKLYETDFILFCKVSFFRDIIAVIGYIIIAIGFYYARYSKFLLQDNA